jgi:hypothetical protein
MYSWGFPHLCVGVPNRTVLRFHDSLILNISTLFMFSGCHFISVASWTGWCM